MRWCRQSRCGRTAELLSLQNRWSAEDHVTRLEGEIWRMSSRAAFTAVVCAESLPLAQNSPYGAALDLRRIHDTYMRLRGAIESLPSHSQCRKPSSLHSHMSRGVWQTWR
jgi:hypothetical protein